MESRARCAPRITGKFVSFVCTYNTTWLRVCQTSLFYQDLSKYRRRDRTAQKRTRTFNGRYPFLGLEEIRAAASSSTEASNVENIVTICGADSQADQTPSCMQSNVSAEAEEPTREGSRPLACMPCYGGSGSSQGQVILGRKEGRYTPFIPFSSRLTTSSSDFRPLVPSPSDSTA
ncbi:hypothetical protein BDZ89DRAFT_187708 [Hymenopellis radicata]|nr:hypothetical protein BDZ89DRAFT_187708 [Hymenopellis radicata]